MKILFTPANIADAVRLHDIATNGHFTFLLTGPANAGTRAAILSALHGMKIAKSKAGINALQEDLFSALGVVGDREAGRNYVAKAKALLAAVQTPSRVQAGEQTTFDTPADAVVEQKSDNTRPQAGEVKRNDGRKAYRLEGSDRIEWLPPMQARVRNRARSDSRKWIEAPDAWADEVVEAGTTPTFGEFKQRLHEGIRHDNEVAAQRQQAQMNAAAEPSRGQEAEQMKTEKNNKKSEHKGEKKSASTGGTRVHQSWKGHGMCEILRLCGKRGFSKDKAEKIAHKLGLKPQPGTLQIQVKMGRNGEKDVAKFSQEEKAKFDSIANDIPDEGKKAKSKDKGEGNGKRKMLKKHAVEAKAAEAPSEPAA